MFFHCLSFSIITTLCMTAITAPADTVDLGNILGPAVEIYRTGEDDSQRLKGLSNTYKQAGLQLKGGDVVRFSDGFEAKLIQPLGENMSSNVWQIEGGKALRLPLYNDPDLDLNTIIGRAEEYLLGHRELRPIIPQVLIGLYSAYDQLEYAVVDLLVFGPFHKYIDFEQFSLAHKNAGDQPFLFHGISSEILENATVELAKATSKIQKLSDGLQLGWNGKAWVLSDMASGNTFWNMNTSDNTLFDLGSAIVYDESTGEVIGMSPEKNPLYEMAREAALNSRECTRSLGTSLP